MKMQGIKLPTLPYLNSCKTVTGPNTATSAASGNKELRTRSSHANPDSEYSSDLNSVQVCFFCNLPPDGNETHCTWFSLFGWINMSVDVQGYWTILFCMQNYRMVI